MANGFSSANPGLARGLQYAAKPKKRRRSSGGGGSSRSTPSPSVSVSGNTVTINGKGYSVAPSLQASFIQRQTNGVGSSAQAAIEQARQTEIRRVAEMKRVAELRRKAEAQREANRIRDLKAKLIREKAQRKIIETRDAITKQRLRQEIIINPKTNERVLTTTNLDTGKISTRTFQRPRDAKLGSKRTYESGGLTEGGVAENRAVKKNLEGQGLKVITNKHGHVMGFSSPVTQKTYPYTERGIKAFEKDYENKQGSSVSLKQPGKISKFANYTDKKMNAIYSTIGNSKFIKNLPFKKKFDYLLKQTSRGGKWTYKKVEELNNFLSDTKKTLAIEYNKNPYAKDNRLNQMNLILKSKSLTDKEKEKRIKEIRGTFTGNIDKELTKASLVTNILVISSINTILTLGIATPVLIKNLVKNPLTTLSALPPAVWQGVKEDGKTLLKGSGMGRMELVVEYATFHYLMKGAGKVIKKVNKAVVKLSPKTYVWKNGKLVLKKAPAEKFLVKGTERLLKERVKKASIKRPIKSIVDIIKKRKPGQFRKFTKSPGLVLKEQTVKSGAMPIWKQSEKYAGKRGVAVNTAADRLTSLIRRKKIIRKPIPGETNFPKYVKQVLKKLDDGKKLKLKEIQKTNTWLQKNVAPNTTILERSLYVDPASGLRLSRLGIQPDKSASLIDILRGNFKWGKGKPQVLVFENAKFAKNPKHIKKIIEKFKKTGKISPKDLARDVKFKMKPSAEFKVGGSFIYGGGMELEATAYGVYIKRLKKLGQFYYKGTKVTIVSAELYKPSKTLLKQLKLAQLGKLTEKAVKKLEKTFSKILKRKIKVETPHLRKSVSKVIKKELKKQVRRSKVNVPILRWDGRGLRYIARSFGKRLKTPRATIKRKTSRIPMIRKRIKTKIKRPKVRRPKIKRPKTPRPGRPKPPKTPRPGRPKPPKTPKPFTISGKFKKRNLRKAQPSYYVKIKRRGKIINLTPRPLTKKDAKDFLAYNLDHGLERSAWFEPLKKTKKVVKLPSRISGYFSKHKQKLRPFKIRVGKKKAIRNGFIEKRKYNLDTPREKRQMKSTRRKSVRRKVTPKQRKAMLLRLKKARAVRLKNLRRRR